ncbi:MAG TPA: hypothetical protein VIW70_07980 [Rubrivivax sp.]
MDNDVDTFDKRDPPTAFTAFKPVGHVVLALPDDTTALNAAQALQARGLDAATIVRYSAAEQARLMGKLIDDSSGVAEFGHEIVVMRKFLDLALEGCGWLVVASPDEATENTIVAVAQSLDAKAAVKYGRLVITDLI